MADSHNNEEPTWTCTECDGVYPMDQFPCPHCDPETEEEQEPAPKTKQPDPPRIKEYGCSPVERKVADEAVKVLKRHLAKKFHPDAGGSEEEQQTVNFLIEKFEQFFITNPEIFAGI
jgi:hypothetical protein